MTTIKFIYKNKTIKIYLPENTVFPATAIYALCGEQIETEAQEIIEAVNRNDFCIVSFFPVSWDIDYTPWPATPAFKGNNFIGKAPETLNFLSDLIPEISKKLEIKENAVLGYSLGGLMALWSMYESNIFSACACCSGSLWYDGFINYLKEKHPRLNSRIYLSLGKGEHKTKNEKMKLIDQYTSEVYDVLKKDFNVYQSAYVQNEGGHFTEIPSRLALGIKFILEKNQ